MSESQTPMDGEQTTYVICVVALDKTASTKKTYKNFYMGVKGNRDQAVLMQNQIARSGFMADSERVFPDSIESINLKESN